MTQLFDISEALSKSVSKMHFSEPITHVYNPLEYTKDIRRQYLERYLDSKKQVVLLGMNPGPYGMAQTGVPFGEISAVRDWMGLSGDVKKPKVEHPKRPIDGLACTRSEVSGRRLWGFAAEEFGTADAFFSRFAVANYCPLVFMEASGKNRTPDKLPASERAPLFEACGHALLKMIEFWEPEWVVGVGKFAEDRLRSLVGDSVNVGRILHPSPASPAANRGWAPAAKAQLEALGLL